MTPAQIKALKWAVGLINSAVNNADEIYFAMRDRKDVIKVNRALRAIEELELAQRTARARRNQLQLFPPQ